MKPTLPFASWTIEDARKAATMSADASALVQVIRNFYDGDHWQGGAMWIGPWPAPDDVGAAEVQAEIQRAFVSRNVIKEVINRHQRGVIGQEPQWAFTPRRAMKKDEKPTDEEQKEIDMIGAALTEWWDARKIHKQFKDAVRKLLQAERAHLRIFIPSGNLETRTVEQQQNGTTTQVEQKGIAINADDDAGALRAALNNIFVEVPEPTTTAIYTDPATKAQCGIVIYDQNAGNVKTGAKAEVAELTWVDENGGTVIRVIPAAGSQAKESSTTLDLGRHIILSEMLRDPFISDQVIDNQNALNLALTMVPRNVTTGGFVERTYFNAMMPGEWLDKDGEVARTVADRARFAPAKTKYGAGVTNWIRGIEYEDQKDGTTKITDPSMEVREPSPVQPSIDAKRSHYIDILEEVDQVHILLGQEAAPSGRSREEARSDYVASLDDTKSAVESSGRNLLETALALAEALTGKPNVLSAKYRATFECHINAGPIDPADRTADEASVEAGNMAPETAMRRAGILDTDAENAQINASPRGRLGVLKRQGEALQVWTGVGLSIEAAAKIVIEGEDPMGVITAEAAAPPPTPENQPPTDGQPPSDAGGTGQPGAGGQNPPANNNGQRQPAGAGARA